MSAETPAARPAPKKKPKKKTPLWLILLGSVVVVGIVAAAVAKGRSGDKGTKVMVEEVVRRDVTQFVTATGKIEPEVEVKIAPEVSGEIVELPFAEGAAVTKGQLLLRIKDANYRYQVAQREADLVAARATSIQSRARLEQAQEDLERSQNLHNKELLSYSEFSKVRTEFEVAEANYESAQAQVRRSEGLLSQSHDLLEKTTIYAPMDGTISRLPVEVGERVAGTGQFNSIEVMRVADLSNMEVVVKVNENDVVNVKVGNPARIDVDAFPHREFRGEVTEIASTAIIQGAGSQAEVTNFEVKIRIDADGETLKPGMSALADIETATVKDVLVVPIQSVTVRSREDDKTAEELVKEEEKQRKERGEGEGAATARNLSEETERQRRLKESLRRVVFVVEEGKALLIDVETGLADTTYMEIKSGLEEGQKVVSGSYAVITRKLKDDMKVTVKKKRGAKSKDTSDDEE
jgi:HlyD family secretion protein